MKKIAYMAPEMEVMEFEVQNPLLEISGGAGDPSVHDEVPPTPSPILD